MAILSELLTVPSADPDNERRARLLNILLLATAGLILLALCVTIFAGAIGLMGWSRTGPLLLVILAWLAGVMIVYLINRTSPGWLGNTLFLLLLLFIPFMLEDPKELIAGRSLFVFAIPILVASVLLRPYASFVMACIISVLLTVIGFVAHIVPNPLAMVGFLAIALVSWLSARSLEVALADLRRANQELDRRVDERTRDLAEALAREHAESSKGQAILEGIADGVIVFDNNGQSILANPAIGRILERPHDEIVGREIEALMGEGVSKDDQEMLVKLLRDRELRRSSVKFEWGDKTLSVSFAPVRATSGEVSGTAAVFRDYTQEAEVARLKSDFVSIVSHELRTPLTSIKGYLDLLLMGAAGKFSKQQQSFLEIARMNAERLHQLVNDLLDMSRIESGKVELDIRVVSLPGVIDQVVNSLQKEFEDRRLTLERDIPADVPEVFGDPGRIAQIFTNLLSNACKYTKTGGATIRVRAVRGALQIDIIDTGVGISYEDQKRLFSRFFRADDTSVRQQPGTGLGLNIARSLVEMHGGEIWAESEPEMGSTFSFTLPLPAGLVVPTNGEGTEEPVSIGRPDTTAEALRPIVPSGPWIMVVDDDSDVANLFRLQLEREGYRVSVVSQGSRAVEVARQLQPELITLDLLMDVDGLTVLKQLKADPVTMDIPVVIVSVVPQPEEGFASGAVDYLIKPLNEGSLLACVRRVLAPLNGGTRNRILVVDDEIDIVGWLKHSLTHFGYHVTEAYDGVQALEAVEFEMPDLILLDLKMPRMDGRMTIRRLREQEATRKIPIIVLSAHPVRDESERVQMLDLGVREFLNKPVTMDQLVAEVQKHLGPTRAEETA